MNPITNPDDHPRSVEESLDLGRRVDALERRLASLDRVGMQRPTGGRIAGGLSTPAAFGVAAAEAPEPSLYRRIEQLARRLGEQERRSAELADQADSHLEMIRMLCLAIKDLDDPYGMGASLDERIGLDEACVEQDDEAGA